MLEYLKYKISTLEFKKLITVVIDQGLVSLTSFLISVILANNFDKLDYANFILLTSITMMILGFQRAIITQPFAINFNDYTGVEKINYLNYNVLLKIIFNLLLLLLFPFYLFFNEGNESFSMNLILLFYVIAFTSYFFVKDILLSSRQTKKAFYFGSFISILIFLLLVVIYSWKIIDLRTFILGLSFIYFLSFVMFFFLQNRIKKKYYNFKNNFLSKNWEVGKWIVGSNLLYSIFHQATPWIVLYFLSKNEVAIYAVLISITHLMNPVLTSLSSYLLPLFTTYTQKINFFKKKFVFWECVFLCIAIVFLIFGIVFGEWLITIIFGSKYANLGWIVILPFICQSINVLFKPVDIAMNALKKTDLGFYMQLFRTFLSLLLAYIFILNFGLAGVFIAKIIETLLYQIILFSKIYKLMTI